MIFAGTVAIAIAQPLFLNSWTTLAARWFPQGQRATAISVVTLANLVGTAIGMVAPPAWVARFGFQGISGVQQVLAWTSVACTVLFIVAYRNNEPSVTSEEAEPVRALEFSGIARALRTRSFLVFLLAMFIGMGVFNGVTQWLAEIIAPIGMGATEAGTLGALMLGGGLAGAVILSPISDRMRKRVPFIVGCLGLAVPATVVLAVTPSDISVYVASFVLGMSLVPVLPVGMQYATEITPETNEGASNGLAQLVGQASVVLVAGMWALRTPDGRFTASLLTAAVLLAVVAIIFSAQKEARLNQHEATPDFA